MSKRPAEGRPEDEKTITKVSRETDRDAAQQLLQKRIDIWLRRQDNFIPKDSRTLIADNLSLLETIPRDAVLAILAILGNIQDYPDALSTYNALTRVSQTFASIMESTSLWRELVGLYLRQNAPIRNEAQYRALQDSLDILYHHHARFIWERSWNRGNREPWRMWKRIIEHWTRLDQYVGVNPPIFIAKLPWITDLLITHTYGGRTISSVLSPRTLHVIKNYIGTLVKDDRHTAAFPLIPFAHGNRAGIYKSDLVQPIYVPLRNVPGSADERALVVVPLNDHNPYNASRLVIMRGSISSNGSFVLDVPRQSVVTVIGDDDEPNTLETLTSTHENQIIDFKPIEYIVGVVCTERFIAVLIMDTNPYASPGFRQISTVTARFVLGFYDRESGLYSEPKTAIFQQDLITVDFSLYRYLFTGHILDSSLLVMASEANERDIVTVIRVGVDLNDVTRNRILFSDREDIEPILSTVVASSHPHVSQLVLDGHLESSTLSFHVHGGYVYRFAVFQHDRKLERLTGPGRHRMRIPDIGALTFLISRFVISDALLRADPVIEEAFVMFNTSFEMLLGESMFFFQGSKLIMLKGTSMVAFNMKRIHWGLDMLNVLPPLHEATELANLRPNPNYKFGGYAHGNIVTMDHVNLFLHSFNANEWFVSHPWSVINALSSSPFVQ
jgi:hypothetical protein